VSVGLFALLFIFLCLLLVAWLSGVQRGRRCGSQIPQWTREVGEWVTKEFGQALERPQGWDERGLRAVEEVVELAQSLGTPLYLVFDVVENVYSKEPGNAHRELGQAFLTLLAVAHATGSDIEEAFDDEWERVLDMPEGYFANRMRRKVERGHAVETVTKDGQRSRPL
jgi:NTP pyrophosphatase (non-canonical NTP hydrolase)